MYTVRKEFRFEASHRLTSSYTKRCKENIHGHSYRVEVFFTAAKLNRDGMVMDFKMIGDKFAEIIDQFDHALILDACDLRPDAQACRRFTEGNTRLINFPGNPTAENMAHYFYHILKDHVPTGVRFTKIRIWETAKCYAEYEGGHHG